MKKSLGDWVRNEDCRLGANDCTRLHKLADAIKDGEIYAPDGLNQSVSVDDRSLLIPPHTFVVRHDWLAAVGESASDIGNDFRLPYPHCAFEFRINGKTLINIAMQQDSGELICCGFVEHDGRWVCFGEYASEWSVPQFAWDQIRAICISLDAEVAIHNVVRAPAKLNEKRVRNGLTPVFDHHFVDLSRRSRCHKNEAVKEPRNMRRLHFRRGHWRHYDDHKTWIKWTLAGNPDLGFIDHCYRL